MLGAGWGLGVSVGHAREPRPSGTPVGQCEQGTALQPGLSRRPWRGSRICLRKLSLAGEALEVPGRPGGVLEGPPSHRRQCMPGPRCRVCCRRAGLSPGSAQRERSLRLGLCLRWCPGRATWRAQGLTAGTPFRSCSPDLGFGRTLWLVTFLTPLPSLVLLVPSQGPTCPGALGNVLLKSDA